MKIKLKLTFIFFNLTLTELIHWNLTEGSSSLKS